MNMLRRAQGHFVVGRDDAVSKLRQASFDGHGECSHIAMAPCRTGVDREASPAQAQRENPVECDPVNRCDRAQWTQLPKDFPSFTTKQYHF